MASSTCRFHPFLGVKKAWVLLCKQICNCNHSPSCEYVPHNIKRMPCHMDSFLAYIMTFGFNGGS